MKGLSPEWLEDARRNGLTITERGVDVAKLTPMVEKMAREAEADAASPRVKRKLKRLEKRLKADAQTPTTGRKPTPKRRGRAEGGLSEAEFQKQVIDLAHARGYKVAHFRAAHVRTTNNKVKFVTPVAADGGGFPDLILVRDGTLIAMELKVGRNKPSEAQLAWLALFRASHNAAHCFYPEDWTEIVKVLR